MIGAVKNEKQFLAELHYSFNATKVYQSLLRWRG